MATTLILPFKQTGSAAPNFYITMDGVYSMVVKFNVSAQRFYFDLYDPAGTWLVSLPIVSSAPSVQIISWRYLPEQRAMLFVGAEPRFRTIGELIDGTLEGVDPPSLNGRRRYQALSPTERIFPVAQDPGQIVQLGSVNHYVNLIDGYVPGWNMIFRNNAFEVFRG